MFKSREILFTMNNPNFSIAVFAVVVFCAMFGTSNGLIFFEKWPIKELKSECNIDSDCTSNRCLSRTDFFCAAKSKITSIIFVFINMK